LNYNGDTVSILNNILHRGKDTGIGVYNSLHTVIADNNIHGFYNGIQVEYSYNTDILGNVLTKIWNDGIQVRDGNYNPNPDDLAAHDGFNTRIVGNVVTGAYGDGIQIAYGHDVLIDNNTLDGNYNGIHLGNDEYEENNGYRGSFGETGSSDNVVITHNNISNSGNAGLYAMTSDNGSIVIAGNTFTDNPVGAWIGSGLIDLTGDRTPGTPNTFTGGDTALRFEPVPLNTNLQLVNNTIGNTQFIGQSAYYVELLNGAFFAPGNPTLIDGTLATYDLVNGGMMTATQLAAIEDKINDYDDDTTLGQIFAGFTPNDNTHVFGNVDGLRFLSGRGGIVITGLPQIHGQGRVTPRTLTALELAGLEPAAGGGEEGDGGSVVIAPCWSQAIGLLDGINVINIDLYQDDETEAAKAARACKGAI